MSIAQSGARIVLKNVLYLTDFSEPSEAALSYVLAIAREYEAKVYVLHVLTPVPMAYATPESAAVILDAQEEEAQAEMQRVGSQLTGLPHETIVERGVDVWRSVEHAIGGYSIDLVVLGTHGRTGAQKLLLGSIAEELFRRSRVPVLTIGPWAHKESHKGAKFRRVLFATDFTAESMAAAPYAISMAQENQARLILLHVVQEPEKSSRKKAADQSITNVKDRLCELVPAQAELWCRPEAVVKYGNPAEQIFATAKECQADLIVLGVRNAVGKLGAATHLERSTAHKVVVHALCPVLTVCG